MKMDIKFEGNEDNIGDHTDSTQDDETQKFNRYNALTLAERIAVIKEFEKHGTAAHLPTMFGCSKAQIIFILKHRTEYEIEWRNHGNPQRVRRPISPHVLVVGIILFEYVWRWRHYPIEITDENLKSVGSDIANMLGLKGFRTSKRWLERFKHCYRLEGSKLLTSTVINDGLSKKSLELTDVFHELREEFASKGVDVMNLTEDHLNVLKAKRSLMLNDSLSVAVAPKTKKIKTRRSSNNSVKNNSKKNNTLNEVKQEAQVEYVEILPDPYESEPSNTPPSTSYNEDCKPLSNKTPKEIRNYLEALDHLKTLEDFAIDKEDFRALGFINHLENYYKEKLQEET